MNVFRKSRAVTVSLGVAILVAGCTGGDGDASGGDGEASYTIGVSNTLTNNGWREEMICSINAQALVSGEVASLSINHRDTDAAGQLEDLRNLIAEGVDAIIVNPADRSALDDALSDSALEYARLWAELPRVEIAGVAMVGHGVLFGEYRPPRG